MTTMSDTFKVSTPSDREIALTRAFDAPRRVVFDAFTKPELIKRWLLGPDGWTMPVCEVDLRAGGRYRYVWHKASTGHEMGVSGTFREVAPPERIVHTEKFDEAWYEGEAVITTTFEEKAGKTTVIMTMLHQSREIRDAILKTGMERGVARSYDRLEEILATA